jgi:hypothetical protein
VANFFDQFDATPAGASGVYDPTEGMSTSDKFFAGMGKSFTDLSLGGRQLLAEFLASGGGGALGQPDSYWQKLADQYRAEADEKQRLEKALMNTGAGTVGAITGSALPAMLVPGGAATALGRIALSSAIGAAQGATQPVGEDQSRAGNVALGGAFGAAGQGVGEGVGALARGAQPGLDAARQAAVDWAAAHGAPLTRGQMSGNKVTQLLENVLSALPGSRGFYAKTGAAQQSGIDQAIGERTLEGNAGDLLQQVGQGKTWTSDQPFVDALQSLPGQYAKLGGNLKPSAAITTAADYVGGEAAMPTGKAMIGGRIIDISGNPKLQAIVAEAQGQTGPLLPLGAEMPMVGPKGDYNNYQAIRSQLTKAAYGKESGTPAATGFADIRDAFDQAATRALEAQGVPGDAMSKLRAAYAIDKTLLPAATETASGDLTYSAPKVATLINKASTAGTLPADASDELLGLANFARMMRPISTSHTTEHGLVSKLATLGLLGDVAMEHGGGPEGAALPWWAKLGLGAVAAPYAVNTLVQGTRGGIPLLRSVSPEAGATLAQIMHGIYPQLPAIAGAVTQ